MILFALAGLGVVGCASGPRDAGVPKGAEPLTDLVSPPGERSGRFTSFEITDPSTLYVFNVSENQLLYHGPLAAGEVLRLSWGGVWVKGHLPSRTQYQPAHERQIAIYEVGKRYRVYVTPGVDKSDKDDSREGSPLTRPYDDTAEREINPVKDQKPLNPRR